MNGTTVRNWRRALEVTRTNNPGSHRLVLGAIEAAQSARFGLGSQEVTGCGTAEPDSGGGSAIWSSEEVALLGVLPDSEVSRMTGRSLAAVNSKRKSLG